MKNIFLLFTLLLTFTACDKKEKPRTHYVSATLRNSNFYSSGDLLHTHRNPAVPDLQIEATMASGATLKIWMNDFSGNLVTFPFDSITSGASYLGPTPSVELPAVHGSVTILTVTPDITGIFHFTLPDSMLIVGNFNIAP